MKKEWKNGKKERNKKRSRKRKTGSADGLAEGPGAEHPRLSWRVSDCTGSGGRHQPHRHGPYRQSGHCGLRNPGDRALQVLQPQVPPR